MPLSLARYIPKQELAPAALPCPASFKGMSVMLQSKYRTKAAIHVWRMRAIQGLASLRTGSRPALGTHIDWDKGPETCKALGIKISKNESYGHPH